MNWLRAAEFKVGLLVVVVGSLIAVMSMQVSDDPSYLGRSKKAWFLLPNAGGLVKNSAVRSAGIPVGVIKNISLQDGKARIDITVKSDVPLTTSASIEVKAQGILGDKHVEVYPGSPTDPPLEDNAQILIVRDGGSLDNLMTQVSEVTTSLKEVAKNLQEATSEDGTRRHVLGRIVKNIETLTGDLAQMTTENKDKVGDIVDDIHDITSSLKEVMNDQSETGLKETWKRLSNSVKNLDEITSKINKGEGAIGKLVSDEQTAENVSSAIDGLSGMLDTANRIQTAFDFRGEYLNDVGATKSYIGVQIQPGLDRYYYIAVVDDPAGLVEKTGYKRTGTGPESPADYTETKTYYNQIKFTVLYAKNFWDLTLKGGLIENSGGFGIDYFFFRRKLKFTLEAFDFENTNVRSSLSYTLYRGIYVTGGINDAFNQGDRRSSYLGAGLFLTNDDLKLLLTKAPF
ncbi:MlaD family protein [Bdellovibrio bacteriovorus]|uniref:Organic solvent ABC transporter substrate-binding protein n=1 Tax=Bdellovibrio bacteriovorus TaxID=959 RepID=A0A150WGG4_BDEBC|nr:MlaD family protein [Bdellovibrio bacteriovorus]KYG62082.1 organic solvent ABC transporter substrate-binding protein [Bdellovibrio bacteriovorus]